jgi:hypothetical protein
VEFRELDGTTAPVVDEYVSELRLAELDGPREIVF